MTIGIFDSGVGGLSILRKLNHVLPDHSFIYVADTAHFPYGEKSREEIIHLSLENIEMLVGQKIDLLVLACHTVSTVAYEAIVSNICLPVVTVTDCLVEEIYPSHSRIALLGTQATIDSKVIQDRLRQRGAREIFPFALNELVSLIERGNLDGANDVLEHYGRVFQAYRVDTVLLACTHYSLFVSSMRRAWGKEIRIIDPADRCTKKVIERIEGYSGSMGLHFYVTGEMRAFSKRAKEILGVERVECKRLSDVADTAML